MSRVLLFAILITLSATSHSTCNGRKQENFPAFFRQFAADKNFAISRTNYPLKVMTWGYGIDSRGNDISGASLSYLSRSEDEKLNSLGVEMKKNNMTFRILSIKKNSAIVHEFAEGTDWGYKLHFSRNGNCWYHTMIEDISL